MPRVAVLTLALVAVLAAGGQLALPALAERRAQDRLEQGGGRASVEVRAVPAVRLLFGDGDRFEAEGRGLRVDVREEGGDLDRLDGFDSVRVHLTALEAGPLAVREFDLARPEGAGRYALRLVAVTTPREVAGFLGSQAGGFLGGVFGDLAAGGLPGGGDSRVPLRLRAQVQSRDGRASVGSARGTVAGVPAGPLAELVVTAVLERL